MELLNQPKLSVILPCRDEEKALAGCLEKIKEVFLANQINGEIIVSDSSTDSSPQIARQFGVLLVKHDQAGYGLACRQGFAAASGRYLFLADADGSYDFGEIPKFLAQLEQGYDFVIGNRFGGKMEPGAMPALHRYFGNPILTFLTRLFFRVKIGDINCGLRALTKEALAQLNLQTTGMEFASEMVIKAAKKKLKIKELPINYYQRIGQSKLHSLADGWRHLRFMLLYCPLFLFFIPGLILFLSGMASFIFLYFDWLNIFGLKFFYHPLFLSALLIMTGYQLIIFSIFAKTYAITHLGESSVLMNKIHRHITIEKAILAGLLIIFAGLGVYLLILWQWIGSDLGELNEIKNSFLALTLIVFGSQTIFSSFMLSILGIKEK